MMTTWYRQAGLKSDDAWNGKKSCTWPAGKLQINIYLQYNRTGAGQEQFVSCSKEDKMLSSWPAPCNQQHWSFLSYIINSTNFISAGPFPPLLVH